MVAPLFDQIRLGESKFGIEEAVRFEGSGRIDKPKREREAHTYSKDIVLIIISAVVFVTVVAVYSVFSTIITNYWSEKAARKFSDKKELAKLRLNNKNSLYANLIFAVFAILLGIILVPYLLSYIKEV